VRVGYGTTYAIPHELLHVVLCQLGDCDPPAPACGVGEVPLMRRDWRADCMLES